MHRINRKVCFILSGFVLVLLLGGTAAIHSNVVKEEKPVVAPRLPLIIAYKGDVPVLNRAPVGFDHDRHTKALKQEKEADCKVCHILETKDDRLSRNEVKVFKFPKFPFNIKDNRSVRNAFHAGCGNCHGEMTAQGKKTGPDIGLCGKCHVRKPAISKVTWGWSPLFNYGRHHKHTEALEKTGVAKDKTCEKCHHVFDEKQKKLVYKKDTANSCRACHKAKDEKNARSMRKVAHAACIGCHMKTAADLAKKGLTDEAKKRVGPFECKGCHGEHKTLSPEEILKTPRLVRGQKDVIDIVTRDPKTATMKLVPFNHKSHEPRAQFCNTCHHHALEKCSGCHTRTADLKKAGGVSFERAFHKSGAIQSCTGCHETVKRTKNCAGCHQWMLTPMPKVSCPVCHRGTSGGKPVEARPLPLEFNKEKVPEKQAIKDLAKEFQPAELPHLKIVKKLTMISNNSPLATAFHAAGGEQAICSGCHHRSESKAAIEKKVPRCSSCHGRKFDPRELGKPGLMAAYHRQCMGCHDAMDQKPQALECVKCHAEKKGEKSPASAIPKKDGPK